PLHPVQVGGRHLTVGGDDLVAGAVVANPAATGDVDVEGQGPTPGVAPRHRRPEALLAKTAVELGRCGVGGVARPGQVVAGDQRIVPARGVLPFGNGVAHGGSRLGTTCPD